MTSPLDRLGTRDRRADRLPPGQHVPRGWPVLHYGPVPAFRADRWDFQVLGATADGAQTRWTWSQFGDLPRAQVRADLHCVTRFSVLDHEWSGVPAAALLALAPPAPGVEHACVWAEHGYSANLRLSDLRSEQALLATHLDGEVLSPERGCPLRLLVPHLYAWKGPKWVRSIEYLVQDRPGFWEERGYHNRADVWLEQRYGYQESARDRPPS